MKIISTPAAKLLKKRFEYDLTAGTLRHRERAGSSAETKRFNSRYAGTEAGRAVTDGSRQVRVDGIAFGVHRIIWKMMTGKDPGSQIDHINGNPADNRWANLREASHTQNMLNRGVMPHNSSGYTSVYLGVRHAGTKPVTIPQSIKSPTVAAEPTAWGALAILPTPY
jgi:hypothetical protein